MGLHVAGFHFTRAKHQSFTQKKANQTGWLLLNSNEIERFGKNLDFKGIL